MKDSISINSFIFNINKRRYCEIEQSYKDIIDKIDDKIDDNSIIYLSKIYKTNKQFVKLQIDKKTYFIRVQYRTYEKLQTINIKEFCNYLISIGHEKEMIQRLLFFFYCDLTYNNTGKIRYTFAQMMAKFPNKLLILNDYLNKYVFNAKIIDKIIFSCKYLASYASYLLVITNKEYLLFDKKEVINKVAKFNQKIKDCIHIGPFILTNLTRNIDFKKKYEVRRKYLLIKWANYLKIIEDN